ncbi:type II toxin-antitoxin system RelE/ParE family toxin [Niabella ginsengisoli]|uniref:Type II toxin-antitoxin system RelE/ParE family toxin n=1 Tax=Niabella ginsengisoli TaxID=522298 RepID=A0ABS9SDZ4_9BACT|nr:type II toxin-antitoxin system RelE/ParE family toxin [Niabella ginsengisoli]MCH5596582.1 type II toxin-antitoxin system RelE/ParE family toxin [Niabella ginsengisoli]
MIIDVEAQKQLREIYIYIRKSSLQNAEKVKNRILATIKELPKNPERHNPDKYRMKNEDGSYRAYEVYKYRIAYHVSAQEIRVIQIRHTSMKPKEY